MELKDFDILICRGNKEISKLIMKSTGGEWSHTCQVHYINGKLCIAGAQKEGFFPRPIERWNKEFNYTYEIYRFKDGFFSKSYNREIIEMYGADYDIKHLTVGFWRKILFGKKVKRKYLIDNELICTEATMKLIRNVLGVKVDNPQNYTPDDVRDFLLNNGFELIGLQTNGGNI